MGIVGWIVVGLLAGLIARGLHLVEPTTLPRTLGTAILGAVLGGLAASLVRIGSVASFFHLGTWVVAVCGASLALAIYGAVVGSRARPARMT